MNKSQTRWSSFIGVSLLWLAVVLLDYYQIGDSRTAIIAMLVMLLIMGAFLYNLELDEREQDSTIDVS